MLQRGPRACSRNGVAYSSRDPPQHVPRARHSRMYGCDRPRRKSITHQQSSRSGIPQCVTRSQPGKAKVEGLSSVLQTLSLHDSELQHMESVLASTGVLESSLVHGRANLKVLLVEYPPAKAKQLVLSCPHLLGTSITDWLKFLQAYGFSSNEIYHILKTCGPHWDTMLIYNSGRILMLLQRIGLTAGQVRSNVVARHPLVLSLSFDQVEEWYNFLTNIGCTDSAIAQQVRSNPRVLAVSVQKDVLPKISSLRHFGCSDADLRLIVPACFANLASQPLEGFLGKLQYLSSVGFTGGKLQQLLKVSPAVLTLAISDIMDKWVFLKKVMGFGVAEALHHPQFFEKDLMCCIRPRYLFVESLGLQQRLRKAGPGSCRGEFLVNLLEGGDEEFYASLGVSSAEYIDFYNKLVVNQYYGVKAAVDVFDRPEPQKGTLA